MVFHQTAEHIKRRVKARKQYFKDNPIKHLFCDCGMLVKGISDKHLKACLILHKQSKQHKEIMKLKEAEKKQ